MENQENFNTTQNLEPVPYTVYEIVVAQYERHFRRLWIALLFAIVMLCASNAAWLYAWMQYDYSSEIVEIDSQDGGNANYIGNDGDIVNGSNYGEKEEANP